MTGESKSEKNKSFNPRRPELVHGKKGIFGVISLALASEIFSKYPSEEFARGVTSEPFDFFSHSANFGYSIVIGAYISFKISIAERLPSEWSQRRRSSLGAAVGLAAVGLANGLTETKFGVGLVGVHTTPDYVDAAYGLVGGLVGIEAVRVKEPRESGPNQISNPLSAMGRRGS